jgi:hypothetical protein
VQGVIFCPDSINSERNELQLSTQCKTKTMADQVGKAVTLATILKATFQQSTISSSYTAQVI